MSYVYDCVCADVVGKPEPHVQTCMAWNERQEHLYLLGQRATTEPAARALADDILVELYRARTLFPGLQHSLHEGFAVMKEEVDEVWDHVKVNQKKRDYAAIRKELIQTAAMAMRTILEVIDTENRV